MSNEEFVEEILVEAHSLGLSKRVFELVSNQTMDDFVKMYAGALEQAKLEVSCSVDELFECHQKSL